MKAALKSCHAANDAGPRTDPRVPGAKQRELGPIEVLPRSKGTRIGSDVCECESIAGDIWGVDQESFGLNERLDGTTGKKLSARFVALLPKLESTAVWRNHFGDEIEQAIEKQGGLLARIGR